MPKLSKAQSRDRKRQKSHYGMQVENTSISTIVEQKKKKSDAIKKKKLRELKESILEKD